MTNLWLSSAPNDFASSIASLMATLYGTSLRLDSSYSAMRSTAFSTAQFFQQTGQVRLHQSVEVCGVSRHPGQQLTEVQDVNVFYILFSQNWYSTSAMSFWDNCGVERWTAHSRARRRAAGFTDFPLLISGLDGFQYINHFKRGQCSFCTFVASFGASTFDRLFNAFSGQNTKSNRNFAVWATCARPLLAPPATYSKWAVPPRITVPSAITASYLPVLASAPAASGSS